MIDFLESPSHVVACRVTGEVTGDDYDALVAALNAAFDAHDRIGLYVELASPRGVTAEAMLKDVRYGLQQLRHLNRFYHVALATDVDWLRTLARWENKILPFAHVRAFPLDERDAARAWAAEQPDTSTPGLTRIPTNRDDVYAYAIRDTLSARDVETLIPEMEAAFAAHDEVDFLVRIESFPAVPWGAFTRDLFQTKLDALRHVRRYALVGGPAWMRGVVSTVDPLMKADLRSFDLDEEAQAWHWLGAEPVAGGA